MSSIVSEHYQFVIGVDTHATTHTFALVAAATGAVLDHAVFPTNTVGLSRAHRWLGRRSAHVGGRRGHGLLRRDRDRALAGRRSHGPRGCQDGGR